MNKRIRELAEQAGFYVALFDPENKENAHIEKFAELLLSDAFKIIDTAMVDPDDHRRVDEIIEHRLMDAAYDVVDTYGIVNAIYKG